MSLRLLLGSERDTIHSAQLHDPVEGVSIWSIDITFEDPTGVYPSPRSSSPTAFTLLSGSSNQFIGVGPGSTTRVTEIAGYRFNFNSPSSEGATATLVGEPGLASPPRERRGAIWREPL
jgi:hypothetical protein